MERRVFKAAVGLVLVLGLIKLWGPLATSRGQQDELTKLGIEKAGLQAQQDRLQEYKRKLASEAGIEAVARRLGYVRDGERRLVFIPKGAKKASSPSPATREKAGKQPAPRAR